MEINIRVMSLQIKVKSERLTHLSESSPELAADSVRRLYIIASDRSYPTIHAPDCLT